MPIITYKNKDGERVPSVTTILSQWGDGARGLQYWYWNKGKEGLDFNEMPEANIGTIAHMMVDYDVKGKDLDLNQFPMDYVVQAKKCFKNWQEWKSAYKPEILQTEISLISEKYQFGGTIDCICVINNKLCVLDLKTGKDIYPSQAAQIMAYKQMWDENFLDHQIDGGAHLIRTGKELASFAHYYYQDFPPAWEAFLHARELYSLAKEVKKLI